MFLDSFWRKLHGPVFNPGKADAMGMVAIGGNLRPATLLKAYRAGVFPWFSDDEPIYWWSPNPRAIIELDDFHTSQRLARTIRSGKFTITVDRAFAGVIRGCADREEGTWITPGMIEAYETLHHLGFAHSVEVWHQGTLAGGVYGVALGAFFAGESMFTRVRDASKVALTGLVDRLKQRGFQLFDIQFVTEHTLRMGASTIPRPTYLKRLRKALASPVSFV